MIKTTKIYYQLDSEERKAIAQIANELAIKDAVVSYWDPLFVMIENIASKRKEVLKGRTQEEIAYPTAEDRPITEDEPYDPKVM